MSVDLTGMATGVKVRSLQYKGQGYIFNGRNRMRTFDGVGYAYAGIVPAFFTPSVATGGTGLTGKYRYFVVPVNTKKRNLFGQVASGGPSLISAEIVCSNNGVTIGNIPATHEDAQVDAWHIYRNRNGAYDSNLADEIQEFFFLAEVPLGTTSYTDASPKHIPDAELADNDQIRFDRNPPAVFKHARIFGDRMFGLGFDPITSGTVTKASKTITNTSLTSNIVTITATAHGYSVGDWVTIGMTVFNSVFDGAYKILSVPTADTFTYAREHADVGATSLGGTAQKINFSSVSLPDGVLGAWFKKDGDQAIYRITGYNSSTSLALDKLVAASLSGATYTIYRDPWDIYISEFGDMEGAGPDGEGNRYRLEVPGFDHGRGLIEHQGRLLVFTPTKIFAIEGKGESIDDVRINPEPIFDGLGAVSGDAICKVDGDVYFMSLRGPCVIRGNGEPQVIPGLNTDWLDGLDAAEMQAICMETDGRKLWVSYPDANDVENTNVWRLNIATGRWFEEDFAHFLGFVRDNGDNGVQGRCYAMQGRLLLLLDEGTTDVVSTTYSGTVTTGGTTSLTNTSGAFATASGGLEEAYVHIFRAGAYVGSRRITSNTSTVLNWSSSGEGGGTLTVNVGDTYEIGTPWWRHTSKTFEIPGKMIKVGDLHITFGSALGSSYTVKASKIIDGTLATDGQFLDSGKIATKWAANTRCRDFAVKIESRTGATVRQVVAMTIVEANDK